MSWPTPLISHCLSQTRTRLRRQLADLSYVGREKEEKKNLCVLVCFYAQRWIPMLVSELVRLWLGG